MTKTMLTGLVIGVIAASAGASFAGLKMFGRPDPAYAQVVDIVEVRKTVQGPGAGCGDTPLARHQLPPDALLPMDRDGGNRVQESTSGHNTHTAHPPCESVSDAHEIVVAYDVTYKVGDERGTVRMDHRPAEHIRIEDGELRVDASIAGRR